MKHAKDRVIALDYFRGICLFLVIINHAIIFSGSLAILAGAGGLWTSAAEMFLLLSGITFGIVRGSQIQESFFLTMKKTWRRAAVIYLINALIVLASLILGMFLTSRALTNDIPGWTIASSPWVVLQILSFKYSIGWANFLMYYAVFLIVAPFLLYALKSRLWPFVVIASVGLYAAFSFGIVHNGIYGSFALWQVYFVLGMLIGAYRKQILGAVEKLPNKKARSISYGIVLTAGSLLAVSYLVEHSIYNTISRMANEGWLPVKLQSIYIHLLNFKPSMDTVFLNDRTGILRPLVTLIVAVAAYLVYRRYNEVILSRTGKLFNSFGRHSLLIFSAQALAIPLLAALPIERNRVFNNLILTSALLMSMWALTQKSYLKTKAANYWLELSTAFSQAKHNAVYRGLLDE